MVDNQIKEVFNYCLHDKNAIDDIEGRRLYLNDIVDDNAIDYIVYYILKYNREDVGLPRDERKPILIYINTAGGSVNAGFSIIDAVLCSVTPVYTINQATCYSMGFLIFLCGEKRYSMAHSTFLCHEGTSGAIDSIGKLKDTIEFETGQMEERTKKYILSRTSITEDLYEQKYHKEWYMYPEEAKKYNIVTDIVGVDCTLEEIL